MKTIPELFDGFLIIFQKYFGTIIPLFSSVIGISNFLFTCGKDNISLQPVNIKRSNFSKSAFFLAAFSTLTQLPAFITCH